MRRYLRRSQDQIGWCCLVFRLMNAYDTKVLEKPSCYSAEYLGTDRGLFWGFPSWYKRLQGVEVSVLHPGLSLHVGWKLNGAMCYSRLLMELLGAPGTQLHDGIWCWMVLVCPCHSWYHPESLNFGPPNHDTTSSEVSTEKILAPFFWITLWT